jgi:hypothetical protein
MLAVALGVVATLFDVTTSADAATSTAMDVEVVNSSDSVSQNGTTCTWTVGSDITIVNLTSQPLGIASVSRRVVWSGSGNPTSVLGDASIILLDDAGLNSSTVLNPNETRKFMAYQVRFDLPCPPSGNDGEFDITVTAQGGTAKTAGAPFLQGGTAVPATTAAAVVLLATGSVAFVAFHIRRRRIPVAVGPTGH